MGIEKTPAIKYKNARSNLLVMIIFTFASVVLLATDAGYSFLFTAYIPQFLIYLGLNKVDAVPKMSDAGSAIFVSLCFIIIIVYLLTYIFSKKKAGWMIAALVLFSIDCLVLLVFTLPAFEYTFLIDYVFHAYVMYFLISGVKNAEEALLFPEDGVAGPIPAFNGAEAEVPEGEKARSESLGLPVPAKKETILIAASAYGMDITVRRTKGLIELIINNEVYARKEEGLVSKNYRIGAIYDGHRVETELVQNIQILYINGFKSGQKLRWR